MKSLNKQVFRAEVSEAREEAFCSNPDCGERFHMSELVKLNEKLVCVHCQKGIHLVVEAKTILKKGANES